ncbi:MULTISPECIES: hypothetical protein [Brevibacillus]|uniref:Uncharacterized protein n=1 Tax=Brevibacillus porteri TaxID=2126350 RepID=A0ABX5FH60_9BACL|nr:MULTISPECIES: hypothetical protein [Brevibacillus]MDC0763120.1 hypothetical protein [Brevibacillus sp. AG]MED1797515.1 hypothetical protein [Brevibacillus porteri]MED2130745.1 hypothetical protein [Brevibacillus porteri]MED2744994.1 hypothetical protein [Brevibacillus porteri]MED2815912.1 hypothetical protein [Brevibacillus porteri]
MKKIVGIALMVALLGFNAYLWPTLIHAVKTDGRTDVKTASVSQKAGTAKPAMDLANQGPRAENVSAYPVEKPVAVSAPVPAPAQKQSEGKPKTKAVAAAKTNTPKKKTQKTKTATKPVKKQTARPPVNKVPTYPAWDDNGLYVVDDGGPGSNWVRLSDGSLLRKSDGTRTFNLPYDKNPFTGEIKPTVEPMSEAAYKMWKGNQAQQPSPFSPSPFGR